MRQALGPIGQVVYWSQVHRFGFKFADDARPNRLLVNLAAILPELSQSWPLEKERSFGFFQPSYPLPVRKAFEPALSLGFHKSPELFNLHRVTAQEVIIVEGFFDCIKVWESLNLFVVAPMGSSMSQQQEKIITARFKRVALLLDGDEAGRKAAEEIASRLIRKLHVRIWDLPDGKQPDQLSTEELRLLLD